MSTNPWEQNLFGCTDNKGICIISLVCPCYLFGKNAAAQGENQWLCCLSYFFYPICMGSAVTLRGRLREKRMIEGTLQNDAVMWTFCPCLVLSQEAVEIQRMQSSMAQSMSRE